MAVGYYIPDPQGPWEKRLAAIGRALDDLFWTVKFYVKELLDRARRIAGAWTRRKLVMPLLYLAAWLTFCAVGIDPILGAVVLAATWALSR